MKKVNHSNFKDLYDKGLSDKDIADIVSCSKRTVGLWRDRNNLKPNFISTKVQHESWSKEKFLELYKQGLSDKEIGKILFINEKTVNKYRRSNNLPSNKHNREIEITKEMEEVLIGTLLGDGNLASRGQSKTNKTKNTAILTFAHCIKQKDYCFHKYESLQTLFNRPPQYNEQLRNNNINKSYYAITESYVSLKKYFDIFYEDNIKIIPNNIENFFTKKSLAYLFMDDGTRKENEYTIALENFSVESINNLRKLLLKWGIETTVWRRGTLYIKSKTRDIFIKAIQDYIIPTMKYKCPYKIP